MQNKICTKCKIPKSTIDFYFNTNKNRFESVCKICGIERCKQWRLQYPDRNKKSQRDSLIRSKIKNPMFALTRQLASSMITHAKTIKVKREINADHLRELFIKQNGNCYYTGIKMKLIRNGHRDLLSLSVDRIDSTIGYVNDNVVLCCWGINALKGCHSPSELYKSLSLFYNSAYFNGKIKNELLPFDNNSSIDYSI